MNPMASQEFIVTGNSPPEIMDGGIAVYMGKKLVATGWAPAYVPQRHQVGFVN